MTDKDVCPEKDLLEEAAAIKRFEYSPSGKELKKQTSVSEKQYGKLENVFESLKRKKTKQNIKEIVLSQIQSTMIILLFTNIATLKNLLNVHLIQNEMI